MKKKLLIGIAAIGVICAAAYTQLSVFVIQPLGMLEDGKTIIMLRQPNMNFIDSADGMCDRKIGGVSLMCRGFAIAAVGKEAKILARLPYSSTLYSISTGGKSYNH